MKKLIIGMGMAVMSLMAADYSQMTTEELNALRGTVAAEDRDAFRAEMQKRVQAMTPQERQTFKAARGDAARQKLQDGSGAGRMNKGGENLGEGIRQRLQDGSGAGTGNKYKGTQRGGVN